MDTTVKFKPMDDVPSYKIKGEKIYPEKKSKKSCPTGMSKIVKRDGEKVDEEVVEYVKQIDGFPSYLASTFGKIYSCRDGKLHEISAADGPEGYKTLILYRDGDDHFKYVHQLIADTFLDNPDGKEIVNHVDGDKHNNHIDNLEWADKSENSQHAYDNDINPGAVGELNGSSKISNKEAESIAKSDDGLADLADKYGVSKVAIWKIRSGKRKSLK